MSECGADVEGVEVEMRKKEQRAKASVLKTRKGQRLEAGPEQRQRACERGTCQQTYVHVKGSRRVRKESDGNEGEADEVKVKLTAIHYPSPVLPSPKRHCLAFSYRALPARPSILMNAQKIPLRRSSPEHVKCDRTHGSLSAVEGGRNPANASLKTTRAHVGSRVVWWVAVVVSSL